MHSWWKSSTLKFRVSNPASLRGDRRSRAVFLLVAQLQLVTASLNSSLLEAYAVRPLRRP